MRFPLFIFTVHCPTLCLFCFHLYLDLIILLKGEVKRQGPKWQGRAIAVLFEEFSLLVPLMAIQCIRMFWIIAFVWSKAHFYSQAQIEYHWRLWRKHDRDLDLMDVKHEGHSPLESSLASLIGGRVFLCFSCTFYSNCKQDIMSFLTLKVKCIFM